MKEYQYHIFSPYRVCPLGAHVDHQHGLVTGFAIDKGVDLYFDVNDSQKSKVEGQRSWPENHVHLESRTFEVVKIASEAEREYIRLSNGLLDQAWIPIMRPWRNTVSNEHEFHESNE